MGDKSGATPADKETRQPAGQKSKTVGMKELPSKTKKGSVLSAIEDIQRMSPEAITKQFDRLIESAQARLVQQADNPCAVVATQLLHCHQSHSQQSYKCFPLMDEYRKCVALATQDHVDRLIEKEERAKNMPLPIVPPRTMVTTGANVEKQVRNRSWYKPWSWSWLR